MKLNMYLKYRFLVLVKLIKLLPSYQLSPGIRKSNKKRKEEKAVTTFNSLVEGT